jgi:signal transduction histidine kinase
MTVQNGRDDAMSVASEPATPRQRKIALAFSVGVVLAFGAVLPIALTPLVRIDSYIPSVQALIAATEFITAVLLFAQYAADRSRALLFLAGGYLLTALIVVAHTLTFPGAVTPTGLLGAGAQTAAWLYVAWHVALPGSALVFALLRRRPIAPEDVRLTAAATIWRTGIAVVAAACAITWALVIGADSLPALVISERGFAPMASAVTASALMVSIVAFAILWNRRTSVLDEWLLVALSASIAETALVVFIGASRYTLGFYLSRPFAVIASSAVLVALASEMTRRYVRLSVAVRALQRERANRLMSLDVLLDSIAHEMKQPLTVLTMCASTVKTLLRQPKLDKEEMQSTLDDMELAGVRIGETLDGMRTLLKDAKEVQQQIDVNEVALESLRAFNAELSNHDIALTTELAAGLPPVMGHRGQLREVFVNIVQNAIDALATMTDRPRTLRIRTVFRDRDRISITIEDSGPGIEPGRLAGLFNAFVTTKTRGMGLGLGICQMIVDRHNGRLSVSSELGKGTLFEVALPAETAVAPERSRVAASSIKAEA